VTNPLSRRAGALTVTIGLLVLTYGIVQTDEHGWGSPRTLLTLAAGVLAFAPAAHAAPPNVLIVLTDDQRWDTLSALPDLPVQTNIHPRST
jgi:hypothetical protein